jgi:hypothetical protein
MCRCATFEGSNIKRPGAYAMSMIMVVVLRYGLSSSTHMGVQEECVFNWKYTDSYKNTMPGLTL